MKKRNTRLQLLLTFTAALMIAFSQNIALASAASWVEVARFTGSGTERYTTDYFIVESPEWQILWSYIPDMKSPDQTFFIVFTHPKGNDTFFIDSIIRRGSSITEGNSSIHHQKGTFYMIINSTNVKNYTIIVQQEILLAPEFPNQAILPLFAIATLLVAILYRRKTNKIK